MSKRHFLVIMSSITMLRRHPSKYNQIFSIVRRIPPQMDVARLKKWKMPERLAGETLFD